MKLDINFNEIYKYQFVVHKVKECISNDITYKRMKYESKNYCYQCVNIFCDY